MADSDATYEELQERMDRMEKRFEERIERLRKQVTERTLVHVRALAERDNEYPNTYSGLVKMMKRLGVPKRRATGQIKEKGSKKRTYVSLTELEAGERRGTQSVQRQAGLL